MEALESRIAPATFHWNVDASGDWNSPANWFNETTNTAGDGVPAYGDTVIFGSVITADRTITIPDAVTAFAGAISFDDDNHYTIAALGTGKLSGVTSIAVAATAGEADHMITAPISVGGALNVTNHSTVALLDLSGAISGSGSLNKSGPGTLRLSGASGNTYTSSTSVEAGVLELAKTSGLAVPQSMIIGYTYPGDLATVRLLASNQIFDGRAGYANVAISDHGTLDLNGFDDAIGSVQLSSGNARGAVITTGLGTVTVQDITLGASGTGLVGASITGKLSIGSTQHDFSIVDGAAEIDLLITADLSGTGAASLVKEGSGRLQLNGTVQLPNGIFVLHGTLGANGNVGTVVATSGALKTIVGDATFANLSANYADIQIGDGLGRMTVNGDAQLFLGSVQVELGGLTAGTTFDQLVVAGALTLNGTALDVVPSFASAAGDQFMIVNNTGASSVSGTFAGLSEGAIFGASGQYFQITYQGGDGNDVVLKTLVPELQISPNQKQVTYLDVDGDLVTVKTSVGRFDRSDFVLIPAGKSFGGQQLALLNLADDNGEFTKANISITAKRTAFGGNGTVNVGYVDAWGTNLGTLQIAGDLGAVHAGDGHGHALKSLMIGSLGELGTSTQEPNGTNQTHISGTIDNLLIRGSVRGAAIFADGITTGKIGGSLIGGDASYSGAVVVNQLGALTIGGSVRGGYGYRSGSIVSDHGSLGRVTIGGSLEGGSGAYTGIVGAAEGSVGSVTVSGSIKTAAYPLFVPPPPADAGSIFAGAQIGAITVRGDILGRSERPVLITASGQALLPAKGPDLAIKSLTISGSVESLRVLAGYRPDGSEANADASIGSITVGGDWRASTVLAGTHAGNDGREGTADDAKLGPNVRDQDGFVSQIASVTIKGAVYGDDTGKTFGIIAEQITKARIGSVSLPFKPGPRTPGDFFALVESPILGPVVSIGEVTA